MNEIVKRERLFDGELLQLEVVTERGAQGEQRREIVRHQPGVAIVVLQEQSDAVAYGMQLVMVQHYRTPIGETLVELVAGMMDEGESPLEAAQRELREETGLEAERWDELGSVYSSPGFTDEKITLFLARGVRHVGRPTDEGEELSLCMTPLSLALEQLERGDYRDLKTVAGLLLAAQWLQRERAS